MLEDIYASLKEKMKTVSEVMRSEFATIRTGRASAAIFEKIKVTCYNSTMPLNQIAAINIPDPHQIIVQPWDKSVMQEIEKAINASDLKLSPVNDGSVLRISIPPLSKERREDLTKVVKKKAEEGKIALRNVRRDFIEKIKKMDEEGKISEDESRKAQERVQKITDDSIAEVDLMAKHKETEILQF
jgi:ribosome recycling factor